MIKLFNTKVNLSGTGGVSTAVVDVGSGEDGYSDGELHIEVMEINASDGAIPAGVRVRNGGFLRANNLILNSTELNSIDNAFDIAGVNSLFNGNNLVFNKDSSSDTESALNISDEADVDVSGIEVNQRAGNLTRGVNVSDNFTKAVVRRLNLKHESGTTSEGVLSQNGAELTLMDSKVAKLGSGSITKGFATDRSTMSFRGNCEAENVNKGLHLTDFETSMMKGSGPRLTGSVEHDVFFDEGDDSTAVLTVNAGSWDDEAVNGNPAGFRSVNNNIQSNRQRYTIANGLSVGRPGNNKVHYIGSGAPYFFTLSVFKNTDGEVGTWTDETTNATNFGASTTLDMFDTVTTNNAIYFGSTYRFYGLDAVVSTAGVLGIGDYQFQYWNGASWAELKIMVISLGTSLSRRANQAFQTQENQSIYMDANIIDDWAEKTLNGESKFWIRVIITSDITTTPEINFVQVHSNSLKIFSDGGLSYLGRGRRRDFMPVDMSISPSSNAASSGNVSISANITESGLFLHPDGSDTSMIGEIIIGPSYDTSYGIVVYVDWKSDTSGGSVSWKLTSVLLTPGDTEAGAVTEYTETVTTSVGGSANVLKRSIFAPIDISDIIHSCKLVIKIERLGSTDTNTGIVTRRTVFAEYLMAMIGDAV